MDVSKIKQRLEKLQSKNKGSDYEKIDYSKIFWKPKEGKQVIRIVPSKFSKDWPFREIQMHYDIGKRQMLALTNWGEKDPIVELSNKLRESGDKEHKDLSLKLRPRMRVFLPVIVRGEEDLGTRLWEFGNEVYTQILKIANDVEEYGDISDIVEGTDLTIEGVMSEYAGRKFVKPSGVIPKRKPSALTNDSELLKRLLEEQPDVLTIYRKYTFDEMKGFLEQWLSPEDETSSDDSETEKTTVEEPKAPIKVSVVQEDEDEDEEEDTPPPAPTSKKAKSVALSDLPFDKEDDPKGKKVGGAPKKASAGDEFDRLFGSSSK